MPIRRRVDRRHVEALPAWKMTFLAGYDFFDDLAIIGVATDRYGRPERSEAEAAWRRFGDLFLAEYGAEQTCHRNQTDGEPWAVDEFGMPGRRHVARSPLPSLQVLKDCV